MAVVVIRWGLAMVDVAAYIGAGAVLLDSGLNPFAYGFEDTAQNGPTSLVKPYSGNANIGKHHTYTAGNQLGPWQSRLPS